MAIPVLLAQLQHTFSSISSSAHKQHKDMSNGFGPHLLQDFTAVVLESSGGSTDGQKTSPLKGNGSPSVPELVPFSDFDPALKGADQALESAMESTLQEFSANTDAQLELEPPAQPDSPATDTRHRQTDTVMPSLLPCDDNLGGTDQSLEAAAAGDVAVQADTTSNTSSQSSTTKSGPASHAQRLFEAITNYIQSAGAVATAQQQEVAMATAEGEAQARLDSGALDKQLVAWEWEHEAELQEALQMQGGLGQPLVVAPKVWLPSLLPIRLSIACCNALLVLLCSLPHLLTHLRRAMTRPWLLWSLMDWVICGLQVVQ